MNVPSTFIFESLNLVKLPNKLLVVFLKNLFRYGRKDVKENNGKVHLFLSYSPKNITVDTKVKGLPVRYLRVAADNEEELKLFIKGMREFADVDFYTKMMEDGKKMIEDSNSSSSSSEHQQLQLNNDEDEESPRKHKKIKLLENRILKSASSSVQQQSDDEGLRKHKKILTPSFIEIYDADADEFEGQKYSVFDTNEFEG